MNQDDQEANDKLTPTEMQLEKKDMGRITCSQCGVARNLMNGKFPWPPDKIDVVKGVLTCGECKTDNAFEMKGDEITYLPGTLFSTGYAQSVPQSIKLLFWEALRCFYGAAYQAVIIMCRSCVEEALDNKNVSGVNIFAKIESAKEAGILDDELMMLAHGARLIGRNAAHRGALFSQSQGLAALNATLDLINHIGLQPPLIALQSGTDSNAG